MIIVAYDSLNRQCYHCGQDARATEGSSCYPVMECNLTLWLKRFADFFVNNVYFLHYTHTELVLWLGVIDLASTVIGRHTPLRMEHSWLPTVITWLHCMPSDHMTTLHAFSRKTFAQWLFTVGLPNKCLLFYWVFSIWKEPSTLSLQAAVDLYFCPLCLKPDDGSPMIGCDGCDSWIHWWEPRWGGMGERVIACMIILLNSLPHGRWQQCVSMHPKDSTLLAS